MTDKPENTPAFPVPPAKWSKHGDLSLPEPGMTLLDYFAGQALAGLCANKQYYGYGAARITEAVSCAYDIAEAMLAEREKRMKP